jgi:hypothetical protein
VLIASLRFAACEVQVVDRSVVSPAQPFSHPLILLLCTLTHNISPYAHLTISAMEKEETEKERKQIKDIVLE